MILFIIFFFLAILLVNYFFSKKITSESFFLHDRKARKFLLVLSALSTAIGGGTIFTLIQFGYQEGIWAIIICGAIGGGLVLASFLGKEIKKQSIQYNLYTLPEFLKCKYDFKTSVIAIIVNLFSFLFLCSLQILALSTVISKFLNLNINIALFLAFLIAVLYTSIGGLKSDIITDFVQFIFLIPTIPILLVYVGKFINWKLSNVDFFSIATSGVNPLLLIIISIFVWMPSIIGSMDLWQRIYASKSEKTAKEFLFLSGIFLFVILFLFSIIGILSRANPHIQDIAPSLIPIEIISQLPKIWLAIAIVGVLSALMSTVDSMLIVLSAIFTHDIIKYWKGVKDSKILLKTGRVSLVAFGLLSLFLAILLPNFVQLLGNALSSLAILTPAIIGGLFTKNLNKKAGFLSISSGFFIIVLTLIFTLILKSPSLLFVGQILAFIVSGGIFLLIRKTK